ncbi:MAG: methyltransferase domain-containing protein [candidate division Zixibacteria bacterium]|nr:methyltransferase domain-containing protein [candidate division Zixibacteria bacterium]
MLITDDEAIKNMISEQDAFSREDESDDKEFYKIPRIVEHLDDNARSKVSELLGSLIVEEKPKILDLMAAVSSHLPDEVKTEELVGLGLNEDELKANDRLDRYIIHDLNLDKILPFEDNYFDVVLNTVSVQYITDPYRIFAEVGRILKPGGVFIVIFSNRSFETKSTKVWELLTEKERIKMVKMFFHDSGNFKKTESFISMGKPRSKEDKYYESGIPSDPIYAVFAEKTGGAEKNTQRTVPREDVLLPSNKELDRRKSKVSQTMKCPYCMEDLHKWHITDNPMTTWDHDLYICINDACPYLIRGWREMYNQGNRGLGYRLVYDKVKDSFVTIPVPNLNAIKNSVD